MLVISRRRRRVREGESGVGEKRDDGGGEERLEMSVGFWSWGFVGF